MKQLISVSVVLLFISCVQVVFGDSIVSACERNRPLLQYMKSAPYGAVVVGSLDTELFTYSYGTGHYMTYSVVGNASLLDVGVYVAAKDGYGEQHNGLQDFPTSNDKARLDRDEFGRLDATGFDEYVAGWLAGGDDVTSGPFLISAFASTKYPNNREGLGWSYGTEWQIDDHGVLDDFQGFYHELDCYGSNHVECSGTETIVPTEDHGSFGTGNPLVHPGPVDTTCSWVLSFPKVGGGEYGMQLSFLLRLGDAGRVSVYAEQAQPFSSTLVVEYTAFENGIQVLSFPSNNQLRVVYESGNGDEQEYGFQVVYSKDDASTVGDCFAEANGCADQCYVELTQFLGNALVNSPSLYGYGFPYPQQCTAASWGPQCVFAADAIRQLNACGATKRNGIRRVFGPGSKKLQVQ